MTKGKDFEIAVCEFVKSISPESKVTFDHNVKDKDTGTYRQVDVWIETKFANHIPLTILVSCKDYKRRMDIGHIGTFINEVRSTGASTGVIYSRSGFSKPALNKAAAHGLNCCQLYKDSPADKPEMLVFNSYVCCPRVNFTFDFSSPMEGISTHGDLYDMKLQKSDKTLIQRVQEEVTLMEKERKNKRDGFPIDEFKTINLIISNGSTVDIEITLGYKYYKGKLEAHLVSGSYCFGNGNFKGVQRSPIIDMKDIHPGACLEEIVLDDEMPSLKAIGILSGGKFDDAQVEAMRHKEIVW